MPDPKTRVGGAPKGRGHVWRFVVPVVALIAGPATAAIWWGLGVFVIERDFYVSNYERMESLPSILAIGLFVGVASSLVALAWATRS
jgi:hypothetical protein